MPVDPHLPEDLLDPPLRVDDEGRPLRAPVCPPVVVLQPPGVVELVRGEILITQQREVQPILPDELIVRGERVLADAEDYCVELVELWEIIPERACLPSATRRVVLGVEVENDVLPLEATQLDLFSAA